jgi:dienelactone hydrolase
MIRHITALALLLVACGNSEAVDSSASGLETDPKLEILANDAPAGDTPVLGDRMTVRLTGVAPGAAITVRSSGPGGAASASFVADAAGVIDTRTSASSAGSYTGIEAEGLVWSMTHAAGAAPTTERSVSISAEIGGQTLSAKYTPGFAGATFSQVSEQGLTGGIARPAGATERRPAVLVLHGSEGSLVSSGAMAGYLAAHGYVAYAPIWFGQPGQAQSIDRVPVEWFGHALEWLRSQPDVDPAHVGVVGTSRGGEAALVVGSYLDVQAVVGIVPSGIALNGDDATRSSWTFGGKDLPFLTPNLDDVAHVTLPDGRIADRQSAMYPPALAAHPDDAARAEIPVERTHGPILLLAGADDGVWPSCQLAGVAKSRLERLGHPYHDALECYPDTGHDIAVPGFPTTDLVIDHPILHVLLALGGTPAGTAHAQRAGIERILQFLDGALR